MKKHLMLCLLATALLSGGVHAANPYVTATYQIVVGGYAVDFVLHNALPDETLCHFRIATSDAGGIVSPVGWRYEQDARDVEWIAEAVGSDIPPGASRSGFGFTTPTQPASYDWFTLAVRGYGGQVTPTPVPEPSALLALASGLGIVGLPLLRRRRSG